MDEEQSPIEMMMSRRGFLAGLIATGVAAGVKMPVGLTAEIAEEATVVAQVTPGEYYFAVLHPRMVDGLHLGARVLESVEIPNDLPQRHQRAIKKGLLNKYRNFRGRVPMEGTLDEIEGFTLGEDEIDTDYQPREHFIEHRRVSLEEIKKQRKG